MYRGKDCKEKFVDYIDYEVKWLYETFPQHPFKELTDVLKTEHEAEGKYRIWLKKFDDSENGKITDPYRYKGLYLKPAHNKCNLKYWISDPNLIVFHNLSGYNANLFIKKLRKKFNKGDIGVAAEKRKSTSALIPGFKSSWQV